MDNPWIVKTLYVKPLDDHHMIWVEKFYDDDAKRHVWGIKLHRQGEIAGDAAIAAEALVARENAALADELFRCEEHARNVMLRDHKPRRPS